MFENITQSSSFTNASLEIGIMLLGAFLLGMIVAWIIKPRKYIIQKVVSASAIAWATSYSASKKSKKNRTLVDTDEDDEFYEDETDEIISVKKEKKQKAEKDNLQMIEGVGPKIEKLMNKHGVRTFADVVSSDVTGLEDILLAGWPRYQVHSPTTWPDQARLAMQGKWSELEEYQGILNRGQE